MKDTPIVASNQIVKPAIITPNAIAMEASLRSNPPTYAISIPVYAPVSGNGTLTKSASPIKLKF